MSDSESASEHLRVIRGMMEKATIYRAISAPAAIFGGLLAIVTGSYFFFKDQNDEMVGGAEFFWTWVGILLIADLFNTLLLFMRSKKEGAPLWSSGLRHACFAAAPAVIAGGIISFEVVELEIELCALVWVLCYGAAILAMGNAAPRSVRRLGWAFIVAGIIIFFIWMRFGAAISPQLGIGALGAGAIIMIVTFGLLHLVHGVGVLLRKGKHSELS